MKTYSEKEKEALFARLELLDHVLKLHEWSSFGRKDAEEAEEIESKLEADAEEDDKPVRW